MPQDCATQTWLSMPPIVDEDWTILDDCESELVNLPPPTAWADPQSWPAFPQDYFDTLGHKHIRWGGTRVQKYAVASWDVRARFGTIQDFAAQWVGPRYERWLADRDLKEHLILTHECGQLEVPGYNDPKDVTVYNFVKYRYAPSMQLSGFKRSTTVYHGTFAECQARILWTGSLHATDRSLGLGMESHVAFPAVFTADTLHHAVGYAWPSNFLKDNLYYGIVFEIEADVDKILKRCRRGEVLMAPDGLIIRNVYLFFNLCIGIGKPKNPEWLANVELLPAEMAVGNSLSGEQLRKTAWHS